MSSNSTLAAVQHVLPAAHVPHMPASKYILLLKAPAAAAAVPAFPNMDGQAKLQVDSTHSPQTSRHEGSSAVIVYTQQAVSKAAAGPAKDVLPC
jgi:hypothetical protein